MKTVLVLILLNFSCFSQKYGFVNKPASADTQGILIYIDPLNNWKTVANVYHSDSLFWLSTRNGFSNLTTIKNERAASICGADIHGYEYAYNRDSIHVLWEKIDNKPVLSPIGSGSIWFTNTAPNGYLICDGSAVSRSTYASLFSVISTIYGSGDGSTTFNLPDLRQRFPLGKSASGTGSTIATNGGQIDPVLAIDPPSTATGSPSSTVAATILAGGAASTTHTHTVDISSFNVNQSNPPFLVVNYIIKY